MHGWSEEGTKVPSLYAQAIQPAIDEFEPQNAAVVRARKLVCTRPKDLSDQDREATFATVCDIARRYAGGHHFQSRRVPYKNDGIAAAPELAGIYRIFRKPFFGRDKLVYIGYAGDQHTLRGRLRSHLNKNDPLREVIDARATVEWSACPDPFAGWWEEYEQLRYWPLQWNIKMGGNLCVEPQPSLLLGEVIVPADRLTHLYSECASGALMPRWQEYRAQSSEKGG